MTATWSDRAPGQPVVPDRFYADELQRAADRRARVAAPVTSPYDGAPAELAARVEQAALEVAPAAIALSHDIYDHPEEAFSEVHAAAAVAALVERAGVPVTVGVFGQPTALRAEIGRPGPVIALLAEYDALPVIGHGCGHNVIAGAAAGAFLALARIADDLPGRVVLLGTPAEEGNSGKELLAREGAFDGVDAAIMVHPFGYEAIDHPFIGRRILQARFTGVSAHASASPFLGRNALDAVVLTYQAVGLLRQHLPQGDRLHGIVREGGDRPSIVPGRASIEFYLRSHHPETLKDLSARVADIARGAALATGTGVELEWDPQPFTLPIRSNASLGERWAVHQRARGRVAHPAGIAPLELAASTDFGNVSVRVPGIHPVIAVSPPDVGLHTAEFGEFARGAAGDRAVSDGAHSLALTALDFVADPDLRAAVHDDFHRAGGVLDVARYFD